MSVKRNRVVFIPYLVRGCKLNEFIANIISILQKKYKVCENLASPVNIGGMIHTKAVFLNWVEEQVDYKMKCKLLLHQFFGAKIVWVFHNKLPHDIQMNSSVANNIKWLADKCDIIWLLSKSSGNFIPNRKRNQKKSVYIPHIAYKSRIENIKLEDIRVKYGISENDFVFTIIGTIRPYKNIEGGISAFQSLKLPNTKLMIAGSPVNAKYARQIKDLCEGNQDIILDLRYLSNVLLDGIIGISDVIVLPYHDKSSMNSGVMIQSFSNGKTVISPDICMAKDFAKEGFFYRYRSSLAKAMERAYCNGKETNKKMGEEARCYIERYHNEELVRKKLFSVLEGREKTL